MAGLPKWGEQAKEMERQGWEGWEGPNRVMEGEGGDTEEEWEDMDEEDLQQYHQEEALAGTPFASAIEPGFSTQPQQQEQRQHKTPRGIRPPAPPPLSIHVLAVLASQVRFRLTLLLS